MRRWRVVLWLVLAVALTLGWWNVAPHLIRTGSMPMGLGLQQGVPVAVNLALAWGLRLLTARTSGPGTVGIIMAAIVLPYALLAALLILGRVFS